MSQSVSSVTIAFLTGDIFILLVLFLRISKSFQYKIDLCSLRSSTHDFTASSIEVSLVLHLNASTVHLLQAVLYTSLIVSADVPVALPNNQTPASQIADHTLRAHLLAAFAAHTATFGIIEYGSIDQASFHKSHSLSQAFARLDHLEANHHSAFAQASHPHSNIKAMSDITHTGSSVIVLANN